MTGEQNPGEAGGRKASLYVARPHKDAVEALPQLSGFVLHFEFVTIRTLRGILPRV